MTNPEDLFNSYARHYRAGSESYFIDPALAKVRHKNRLPAWMRKMSREISILDAGCADGYMLSILQNEGFHDIAGVDVSPEMCSIARSRLGGDIKIENNSLAQFLAEEKDSYDVILLHHVIEHVPRDKALDLLRGLRLRLKPGGFLAIRTPNANTLAPGYHCHGDFTHVVAFNERSMLQVLEGAGFLSDRISVQINPPELFWSFRHPLGMMLRMLNRFRWSLNRWIHLVVYMLGDLRPLPKSFDWELEVIARR
ncbi:class I SAM-dependent methyltransferase [Xanthomonas campestris]|uniref:class I SAM-dependent methyltransferase n=1 Tax=Xanthomonas campestris TaxID=339 RepID=UPI000E3269CC|nr:class I SAM-dependent methyltransferase [Xanthomonas campestris]MEA9843627.1 class I SAM-dependent methyltransferase [Xanthomonas campestris pv. raphani]MEA9903114.1 class I SAM-dependent methyltransferase [Xanthomonas campestris pv. raphani]RFF69414.1 class I SAM-dependent methyltransferase [Xanthomonas campestris pv. raphani]